MTRRKTYYTAHTGGPAVQGVPAAPTLHASPQNPLNARLQAAGVVGGCVFGVVGVLLPAAYALIAGSQVSFKVIGVTMLLGMLLGFGVFCGLAIRWSSATAARDWKVDDLERARRWEREDRELDWKLAQQDALEQAAEDPAPPDPLGWLNLLSWEILTRHHDGEPTTRKACCEDGLCTQTQWNAWNRVAKAAGFKSGNTMTPPGDDLDQDWRAWVMQVQTDDEGKVYVKKEPAIRAAQVVIDLSRQAST